MALVETYLDTDATGLNNGASWTDAYEDGATWETNEETGLVADDDTHKVNIRAS